MNELKNSEGVKQGGEILRIEIPGLSEIEKRPEFISDLY